MQYDTGFYTVDDKSGCSKISEITFYPFLPFEYKHPFFCQICARNIIFDASSGETVVIFHLSLTRRLLLCFRPQYHLGSPLRGCSVFIRKIVSPTYRHYLIPSVLETSGCFLVLRP